MTENTTKEWVCPYCKSIYKSKYPSMLDAMRNNHYSPDEITGEPICNRLQLRRL